MWERICFAVKKESYPEALTSQPSVAVTENDQQSSPLPPLPNEKGVGVIDYINQKYLEDSDQYVTLDKVTGNVLLAMEEPLPFTNEEIFDTSRGERLYTLAVVHPSGALQKVGSFVGGFLYGTQKPILSGEYVYYKNNTGGISRFNLRTKETNSVLRGPADWQNQINDFLVVDSGIYYLRGLCGEGGACRLVQYYPALGSSLVIFESIESGVICGNGLSGYNSVMKEVLIIKSCGDAGEHSFAVYGVNVVSGDIRKINGMTFSRGTDPDSTWTVYRDKLYEYNGMKRRCGSMQVSPSTTSEEDLTVGIYIFSKAKMLGCLL